MLNNPTACGDWSALALMLAALGHWLPSVIALAAVCWWCYRIWRSITVRKMLGLPPDARELRGPRDARDLRRPGDERDLRRPTDPHDRED